MNCKVETYPLFDRALKKLGKRYRSIKEDVARLIGELEQNPTMGTDLGDGLRKIRLSVHPLEFRIGDNDGVALFHTFFNQRVYDSPVFQHLLEESE